MVEGFYPEITENVLIESCRAWLGDSQDNGKTSWEIANRQAFWYMVEV